MAGRAMVTPKKATGAQTPAKEEMLPLEERIRQRAHEIYLQRGGDEGSELEDWLRAEGEMQQAEGKVT